MGRGILVMMWLSVLPACGVIQQAEKDKAAADEASMAGVWDGVWISLKESAIPPQKIRAEFTTNSQFKLIGTSETVKGTYTQFPETKSVVMEIAGTGAASLGIQAQAIEDFNYQLLDDEFELRSDMHMMRLKREATETISALEGQWVAQDANGNQWDILIQANQFWINITKSRNAASLYLKGTVRYRLDGDTTDGSAGSDTDLASSGRLFVESSYPQSDITKMDIDVKLQDNKQKMLVLQILDDKSKPRAGIKPVEALKK